MSINVNTQMDAIGTALATITGLRVFDFRPGSAQPPFAFVDFPSITYDNTHARGTDRATFAVLVAVGSASDRASRDEIGAYIAGTGSSSIKTALDSPGLRRVTGAEPVDLVLAGGTYLAYRYDVEVVS